MQASTPALQAALAEITSAAPSWETISEPAPKSTLGAVPSMPRAAAPDHGVLDQLHSLYSERARMETALGMSDADDVIAHVMTLRREQLAAKADVETALNVLRLVVARLEGNQ
jgi:hypothetical protein